MTYTVEDITEMIHHHLVLSVDSDDQADSNLCQLVAHIAQLRTHPLLRDAEWWVCDTCGCSVESGVLAEDGSNFTADGGFYCSDCIPGRSNDS